MTDTAVGNGQSAVGGEAEAPWEWAIVEVFGHRRHVGRIREESRFGATMLRVDVPAIGAGGEVTWTTHWYGGGAIFGVTPTSEDAVMRALRERAAPGLYLPDYSEGDDDEGDGDDPHSLGWGDIG